MSADFLAEMLAEVGKPFGMGASDVALLLTLGDKRHPDALPGECGAIRWGFCEDSMWCLRPEGHGGGTHNLFGGVYTERPLGVRGLGLIWAVPPEQRRALLLAGEDPEWVARAQEVQA